MTLATLRRPFGAVPQGHPARTLVDRLTADVDDRTADLAAALGRTPAVVAELRGRPDGDGWVPDRFYCSLQGRDGTGRFHAVTAHWSRRDGLDAATWAHVPDDPYLPGLAVALGTPSPVEVLRYVPLRRFTYRAAGRVVKVKRRSRLHDSWHRACRVAAAVGRSAPFAVPALLGVDDVSSSYAQADVAGADLATLARGDLLHPLLAEAGAVHAAFHALPGDGLPAGPGPDDLLAATRRDAGWAAWLLPELAGPLAAALGRLADAPAADPAPVTCHGDLVPSHLIGSPGGWTVIDHDLAQVGDRHRDLAMFVAGLPHDVPALADATATDADRDAAASAYLDGYRAAGGRVDERRLAWHLLAAAVHHAALVATKDRSTPDVLAATRRRLAAAGSALDAAGPPGAARPAPGVLR